MRDGVSRARLELLFAKAELQNARLAFLIEEAKWQADPEKLRGLHDDVEFHVRQVTALEVEYAQAAGQAA